MPKPFIKKTVGSLFSLSVDCILFNLPSNRESLKYLPDYAKERILKKFLLRTTKCSNEISNNIISLLINPKLKCIDLSSVNIDDNTLDILKECSSLTDIKLRNYGNQNISSKGLINFFQQTINLLILDVSFCKEFNDDVLKMLALNSKTLKELCAEGCNISDEGFIFLTSNNKKLRCITISHTNISGDGISKAVENKNFSYLQEFRLDNCSKVEDSVLKSIIHNCPKIEILTFYNCAITDETSIFQDITQECKNLKQLHWTITW